jgi:PKD repeat protein
VTVGAGGIAGAPGTPGSNSSFANITPGDGINALRGGIGGDANENNAGAGGSGGGGAAPSKSGGAGTAGQGNNGGTGGASNRGAGGGGASAAGTNGPIGTSGVGGAGGNGVSSNITGIPIDYAGGGGGGGRVTTSCASGGSGGGGAAGCSGGTGTAGTNGLGGGGGAGVEQPISTYKNGGNGGSGIVIIKYVRDIASFTASNVTGISPLLVNFTDTSLSSPTTWNWTFNEVAGNNTDIVFATTQYPNHIFPLGNYLIKLNITSSIGFNVSPQVTWVNVTDEITPLTMFTKNYGVIIFPRPIQFNDTSLNTPTAWNWSFGDGLYSDLQNPAHQYVKRGRWTVLLNASNAAGYNTNTSTVWILGG